MRKVVRVHLVETRHGNETAMFGSPFTSDFRFPKLLLSILSHRQDRCGNCFLETDRYMQLN